MTAFNKGVQLIVGNLGMNLDVVLLLVVILGGIIFYAKDYKIGVALHFFMTSGLFMLLYALHSHGFAVDYVPSLVMTFIFFILMCFVLYFDARTGSSSGMI